jgi:hypothetical protein
VAAVVYHQMNTFEPYRATALADPVGLGRERAEELRRAGLGPQAAGTEPSGV